jgi:hypothetical protein
MKPKIGILSREFKYTKAALTDISKTFERERRRLKEEAKIQEETRTKVLVPIRKDFSGGNR